MSPEEALAELEKKVARLESALELLLNALIGSPALPETVNIAAGEAWNDLMGVGE